MNFNGLMFSCIFFFVASVSFAKLPNDLDGADSSGGGVAVVCRNSDDTIKSVELLDLYEGRIVYNLKIVKQGNDFQENLDAITLKLDTVFGDLKLKKAPSKNIGKAIKDMNLLQGDVSLAPVNDANVIVIPNNCDLEQIAHYKNNSILLINSNLWNMMDDLNKAALIAHEAVYLYQRELGDKTSQYSRKVVAHLFSDYPFESLVSGVPAKANDCLAHDASNVGNVAFKFFKFINPQNPQEEILQFTKFRGKFPYSITRVVTPLWPWPKEEGDLYLDVFSPIELYDQLYIRKSTAGNSQYYFDELLGDYQIKCSQSLDTQVKPAILTIDGAPTYNFGTIAVGSKNTHTFTVTNTGATIATSVSGSGLASPFSFSGGSYPGTGGTCSASLDAGSSCTLVVTYSPATSSNDNDALDIAYFDGLTTQTTSKFVTGAATFPATLTISGGPIYNFGTVATGGSALKTFTVTNTGGLQATALSENGLAAPFGFSGGVYPGTGGTCGASLNAGATCSLVIQFAPTGTGLMSDTMSLAYFDGSASVTTTRSVQGTGAAPALLTISETDPYDFGGTTVGTYVSKTFVVSNTGAISATGLAGSGLASPFEFSGGIFPGKGGTCSKTLASAATCTIVVGFAPMVSVASSDTIDLNYYNGAAKQTSYRQVTGAGYAPALITISNGPTYDFGLVGLGDSQQISFVITNSGGTTATSISDSLSLDAPFSNLSEVGTCGKSLASGASCTIVVDFSPITAGVFNDSINVRYNNGASTTDSTRSITGTGGIPAALKFDAPNILNIGTVTVGKAHKFYVNVENTGSVTAKTIVSAGSLSAPFSYADGKFPGSGGTCSATLAAGASCSVAVVFAPQSAGDYSETLAISYYDGASKQVVLQYVEANAKK